MKKIIGGIAILSAVLVLSGCGSSGNNQANPSVIAPDSQNPTNSNPAANTSGTSVSIKNFAFNPGTLTVKKGATVTWTNNDSVSHTIKSATFNSSSLSQGQTFSFTFNETGTFDYSCGIHPSMLGKIVVE